MIRQIEKSKTEKKMFVSMYKKGKNIFSVILDKKLNSDEIICSVSVHDKYEF